MSMDVHKYLEDNLTKKKLIKITIADSIRKPHSYGLVTEITVPGMGFPSVMQTQIPSLSSSFLTIMLLLHHY